MRRVPITVVLLVLLGAATSSAGPEEASGAIPALGLDDALEIGPDQVQAIEQGVKAKPRRQVRVDATFLRVEAAAADVLLAGHRPDALGSARAIPDSLARGLIEIVHGPGPVRPEPLPPLVLHDGQRGRLSATGHHTYLQDYEVEVGMGGSFLNGPIAGRLVDGTGVLVLPHTDETGLRLDVDAAWAEVLRPIPLFTTSLGSGEGEQVTIELPELRIFQVRKQVELPAEGGYVLAGGGRAWDGESLRLVVLAVRPVAP